ncbi:MAG: acyltransferase [bacterium]
MLPKDLARIWKAIRYDPRNLVYPLRHPGRLASGIYLFNGNRILQHPGARIEKAAGRVQFGCFWDFWRSKGGIVVHDGACLRFQGEAVIGDGAVLEVHPGALLEIGAGTTINPGSRIIALEEIRIGADCAISWEVQIMDGDYHRLSGPEGNPEPATASIHIADHVWIGARSLILKGTRIEAGAVVGAGSVIAGKKVPARTVVAGNPARTVRENAHWER